MPNATIYIPDEMFYDLMGVVKDSDKYDQKKELIKEAINDKIKELKGEEAEEGEESEE